MGWGFEHQVTSLKYGLIKTQSIESLWNEKDLREIEVHKFGIERSLE